MEKNLKKREWRDIDPDLDITYEDLEGLYVGDIFYFEDDDTINLAHESAMEP